MLSVCLPLALQYHGNDWLTHSYVTDTVYSFVVFYSWATLMFFMNTCTFHFTCWVNIFLSWQTACCNVKLIQADLSHAFWSLLDLWCQWEGLGASVVVCELVCVAVLHYIEFEIILLTVWSGSLLTWLLNRRWDNSKQGKSKSYPPPTRCSFGKLYSGKSLFLRCFLCLFSPDHHHP